MAYIDKDNFERFEIRLEHLYDDFSSGRTRIMLEEPLGFVYYIPRSSEMLQPVARKELLSAIIDRFKEEVLSRESS